MTEQNPEEYDDIYPLMGAIGPYLSFTTPVEDEDEEPYPQDYYDPEEDTDFWEEDEL